MDTNNINIDADVSTILHRKLEYHSEQVELHTKKLTDVKRALAALDIGANTQKAAMQTVAYLDFKTIDWERAVKRVLGENGGSMKTVQIMDKITGGNYSTEQRGDLVKAISAALNRLQKDGEVLARKNEGEKGHIYSLWNELQTEQGGTNVVNEQQAVDDLPF